MTWAEFKKDVLPPVLFFVGFLLFAVLIFFLKSIDSRRDAGRDAEISRKFDNYLERYINLYQEITRFHDTPSKESVSGVVFSPTEYHGKVSFFVYKSMEKRGKPVLSYKCNMEEAAKEVEKYSDMIAQSPEETEIVVICPVPDDWGLTELPQNMTLTAIHLPSRKMIAQWRLHGETERKFTIPGPGINYRQPGDTAFSITSQKSIRWSEVLMDTAFMIHWRQLYRPISNNQEQTPIQTP
jgi:hypothetical protein